ncbi:MAG: hypothetical protein HYT40_00415 [Candidatus Sungbacteria bacterium]|uniref:Ig-like domain-containing protein n=1 Tax=Candidatus Sungiibacteriota bacterium TaxID=2750080 RepID=A0A931WPC7_9BACT|nr:hypothetical protein [Candidatus Sungbacteria bacterium]
MSANRNIYYFFLFAATALWLGALGIVVSTDAYGQVATSSAISLSVSPDPPQTDELVVITAALADGSEAVTNFQWFINAVLRPDLSGVGKSAAAFVAAPKPGPLTVRVEAQKPGAPIATQELTISVELSETTKAFQNLLNQIDEARLEKERVESEITIALTHSPENPGPGEITTFTVNSFQFDVASADISWLYNGRRIASGRGVKTATVTIGAAGSTNNIDVVVSLSDGRRAEKSLSLVPSAVGFYWWTDAYAPIWYRGKALPGPGTTILIQARPSFSESISKALTYTWSLNDAAVSVASGPGKNIFVYTLPAAGGFADSIRVRVSNISQTIVQEAEFQIPAVESEALLYESKPLEGVDYSRVLGNTTRPAGKTIDVAVEPFFVPRRSLATLRYQWTLNGKDISAEGAKKPFLFTLTSERDTVGVQDISVSLQDLKNAFIRAAQSIRINLQ